MHGQNHIKIIYFLLSFIAYTLLLLLIMIAVAIIIVIIATF